MRSLMLHGVIAEAPSRSTHTANFFLGYKDTFGVCFQKYWLSYEAIVGLRLFDFRV